MTRRYSALSLFKEGLAGQTGWKQAWRSPEPKPTYDAIIIGGGGHGLATAYYLAKNHGITRVAVLEKGWIGGGNTGRNTTVVRSNYYYPESVELYGLAHRLYEGLSKDLNYNVMATDQGKTSNLLGLALMAGITGRTVPEVGTTAYRPPFTPVPLASFAGARAGELMAPVRRLPLESVHRASGAVFQEYGGWLRPAHYGGRDADADRAIQDEALRARRSVALFDGSTLGKIEVIGPKAAEFVDFLYYNTMDGNSRRQHRHRIPELTGHDNAGPG